jgi:hypothetical protein
MRPLKEDSRTKRRTVADALEVVRQELGVDEIPGAEIKVGPFQLPHRIRRLFVGLRHGGHIAGYSKYEAALPGLRRSRVFLVSELRCR